MLGYWFFVAVTLVGLFAMALRDSAQYSIWPFVTIPLTSVWTLNWLRRQWAKANVPTASGGEPPAPFVGWGRAGG